MSWGSSSTIVPPEPRTRRMPRPHLAACAFGVVAVLLSAATTVFTALDSYALSTAQPHVSFSWCAPVASSTTFLSLVCLAAALLRLIRLHFHAPKPKKLRDRVYVVITALTTVTGLAFTFSTLVLKTTSASFKIAAADGAAQSALNISRAFLPAEWAVLGASFVAQCIFYVLSLHRPPKPAPVRTDPEAFEKIRESMISQARQANILMSFNISTVSTAYPPRSPLHSPAHSTISLSSTLKSPSLVSAKSPRPSAVQTLHNAASRTRLLRRRDSERSNSPSLDPPQEDGFDTWDTSSVDQQTRDAVMGTPRLTSTRLEPIPGSRSGSPIDEPANTLTVSGFSDRPRSISDSMLEPPIPLFTLPSRPPTPSADESHIHPLFRAESPNPLPKVTPATVITAAPMSGQTIPAFPRPSLRSRAQSNPAPPVFQTPERPKSSRTGSPSPHIRTSPPSKLASSPMSSG